MRRSTSRAAAAVLVGMLAGCSLLTDLDGFSGGEEPCTGAACMDGGSAETSADAMGFVDVGPDAMKACDPGDASADPTVLSDAVALGLGLDFTCALRANGTVVCCGDNTDKHLGTASGDA